jgi:hypothetical protein
MDVIGVSLYSSTVQLHGSLGSRRACSCSEVGFSSQNGDRAWVYHWKSAFCCYFLWAKGLNVKDIHKEMFLVYSGKCLPPKTVHNWVASLSLMKRWGSDWDNSLRVPRIVRAMGQVYHCWRRICREIYVSPPQGSNITCYFWYPFFTYFLTLRLVC